jgi:hypothetical protein
LAAAAAAARALGGARSSLAADDIVNPVPFFSQGGTWDEGANCGPATVAAAVNYSQASFPTVNDVRYALGVEGPTNMGQWASMLSWFGAPWYSTWSLEEMNWAIAQGHAIVVAAWMGDLSYGPDIGQGWCANWGQSGRYDWFSGGHGMLITGLVDGGYNYLVHDPNVFPWKSASWYGDGAPKGAFRRYNAAELWYTIATYASGQGLAVIPPKPPEPRRYSREASAALEGPGGGHQAIRGLPDAPGTAAPPPTTDPIFQTDRRADQQAAHRPPDPDTD